MEQWMRPKKTLRCRVGLHRMEEVERGHWECLRCWKPNLPCTSCGSEHNPSVITICVVTR